MLEPVRLVVWDLDETFWTGTLSEGGLAGYNIDHHNIVIELARRGIVSSICSKNDKNSVLNILAQHGIADYFVFPSISWEPKAHRIASLINAAGLRPATVMFIDDNPNNRAEALFQIPTLQVESELFIPSIMADSRFVGKEDNEFSRLKQYKLLEKRKQDEFCAAGSNHDFLRSCDVRAIIDYDISENIDRAIELINRTNQLNFTKKRLSEDLGQARKELSRQMDHHARQAGLIKVIDRYGDYGFIGFFLVEGWRENYVPGAAQRTLIHFCFSCRTLGMLVEKWAYDFLGKPDIHVVGETLTELQTAETVDWIRLVSSVSSENEDKKIIAPEIRVYGGCEANSLSVYLNAYSPTVRVWGNFHSKGLFVRINSAAIVLSSMSANLPLLTKEVKAFGFDSDLLASDFFNAPHGTVYVFSGGLDAAPSFFRYKHKVHDWEIMLHPVGHPELDVNRLDTLQVDNLLKSATTLSQADTERLSKTIEHLQANYDSIRYQSAEDCVVPMHELIAKLPHGSRLLIVLDHDWMRAQDDRLHRVQFVTRYNEAVKSLAHEYPYVAAVSFSDVIDSNDQVRVGGNHYDRVVYLKLSLRLMQIAESMSSK